MSPRRRDGRRQPRIPVNVVYRSIGAAGGRTALARALGVSLGTLARWRHVGRVENARHVLEWAALIHEDAAAQLALARALAGLQPPYRPRS